MMHKTIASAVCLLLFVATSVSAQDSYTTTGGVALSQKVIAKTTLPGGSMLVETHSKGFIWTDDEAVGGNGSLNCYASNIMGAEGMPASGSGTCQNIDADGDVWWVTYDGGMEGMWNYTGGTGKYVGVDGGGTWKNAQGYADMKIINTWEGSWTIPAAEEAPEEVAERILTQVRQAGT